MHVHYLPQFLPIYILRSTLTDQAIDLPDLCIPVFPVERLGGPVEGRDAEEEVGGFLCRRSFGESHQELSDAEPAYRRCYADGAEVPSPGEDWFRREDHESSHRPFDDRHERMLAFDGRKEVDTLPQGLPWF